MLQRDYRLPTKQAKPPLFIYRSAFFSAKVFSSELSHARFGFVTSKKVSPLAVTRNRTKRQLRAVIEDMLPSIRGGYDILFIVHKEAVDKDHSVIQASIEEFVKQKKLLI